MLTVVGVDFNRRPEVIDGAEVWKAKCTRLDAEGSGALKVGELVLAVAEVPGDGFVAQVYAEAYEHGKSVNPATGQPEAYYRVPVTPVLVQPVEAK
jgi:hypothetical protein